MEVQEDDMEVQEELVLLGSCIGLPYFSFGFVPQ